jgi:hypothetical protein
MTWAIQQIPLQKALYVRKDRRVTGRVQSMATVVQPLPSPLEAASIAADHGLLLDQRHSGATEPAQLVSRSNPGRASTQHDDGRFSHSDDQTAAEGNLDSQLQGMLHAQARTVKKTPISSGGRKANPCCITS